MYNDKNLLFIASKIFTLNAALFHCGAKSLLTIPSQIINTYGVDEAGFISFFVPRPQQHISQFDQEFPAELHYYKKGISFSLNVFGKAHIVTDPEDLINENLTSEEVHFALNVLVLIKVKILKAEYFDYSLRKSGFISKVRLLLYNIFEWTTNQRRDYEIQQHAGIQNFG